MKNIYYIGGYKYQLNKTYELFTRFRPTAPIKSEYITMTEYGKLTIKEGYAWDGPSGPTVDTKSFMRGSLVHDALYQLLRMLLNNDFDREDADKLLRELCLEDGMWKVRAWWVYHAARQFGASSARPKQIRKVKMAPV